VEFFGWLFAGCTGWVQFVGLDPEGKTLPAGMHVTPPFDRDGWREATAWAEARSAEGRNVYFSPITQRPGTASHRTEATAFEVPGVFADLDHLPPDAGRRLREYGVLHAAVVSSPGHLHVYAKFAEPVIVTEENRDALKDTLYAFGAGSNVAAHGSFKRPERHDLASLLRVPGTMNFPDARKRKAGRVATPVHLALLRPTPLITRERFDNWRRKWPRPQAVSVSPSSPRNPAQPVEEAPIPADLRDYFDRDATLRWRWRKPLDHFPSLSEAALSLASWFTRHTTWTDGEILTLLVAFYRRHNKPEKSLAALRRTVIRARTSVLAPRRLSNANAPRPRNANTSAARVAEESSR
jgi:hypothetical protein